ncbi:MAG: DUF418 domain-containing protein [Opitutales bacterium]|nr:DUF418 domain-containing protein [Opitutales bacterium]
MNAAPAPVPPSERIEFLDFLRGTALFGILVVNIPLMVGPLNAYLAAYSLWTDPANTAATVFIRFFFEGSFYVLFSLLFGVGFHLILTRAAARGGPALGRYRRRLAILALFGVLHIIFLWYGDILLAYALFGFVLILFRKRSDTTCLVWAGVFAALPFVLTTALAGLIQLGLSHPEAAAEMRAAFAEQENHVRDSVATALAVYPHGGFTAIMGMRLAEYRDSLPGYFFFFPLVLGIMLAGMVVARRGWLADPAAHEAVYRRAFAVALPLALAGKAAYAWLSLSASFLIPDAALAGATLALTLGGPALTVVYIVLLRRLYLSAKLRAAVQAVAAAGRMALTHYIGQSLIVTTIAFNYGFGLYGRINIWQGILLAALIYILQVMASPWWLARFRRGPLEALWRRLTYGRTAA